VFSSLRSENPKGQKTLRFFCFFLVFQAHKGDHKSLFLILRLFLGTFLSWMIDYTSEGEIIDFRGVSGPNRGI
jgi:hypothetical protein